MSLPTELLSSQPIKMNNDTNQPWSDSERDWLDYDSLSPLVHELNASVVQTGKWMVIQHMEFDIDIDSEPYHSSQEWLTDGYSQIFYIVCVWPFGL